MKPQDATKTDKHLAKITQLEEQLTEKQGQYLRALADYQNLERRIINQRDQDKHQLLAGFFRDLIEIKIDLDAASEFNKDEGLKLIRNKLQQFFKKHEITEIDPLNKPFDPEQMECVQMVNGQEDNQVVKVLEKGYLYKSELLKAAKVVVSKLEVSPSKE